MKIKFIRGFSLIELLVVMTVFGLILITISTILINSVRAKNRTAIIQKLELDGGTILDKIRYSLINAKSDSINCSTDGGAISFTDKMDSVEATINCSGGKIASASAVRPELQDLSSDLVTVICPTFAVCSTEGVIDVGFTMAISDPSAPVENAVSRDFRVRVTVRN